MIKFFVAPDAVCGADIYLDKSEDIRHLTRVLRAKTGDAVVISDGMDWEYETEIAGIDADSVTLGSSYGGFECASGNDGKSTTTGAKMYGSDADNYFIATGRGVRMTYGEEYAV